MSDPALPHAKTAGSRCDASQRQGKGLRKILPAKSRVTN
jgi:hypothetical protein